MLTALERTLRRHMLIIAELERRQEPNITAGQTLQDYWAEADALRAVINAEVLKAVT